MSNKIVYISTNEWGCVCNCKKSSCEDCTTWLKSVYVKSAINDISKDNYYLATTFGDTFVVVFKSDTKQMLINIDTPIAAPSMRLAVYNFIKRNKHDSTLKMHCFGKDNSDFFDNKLKKHINDSFPEFVFIAPPLNAQSIVLDDSFSKFYPHDFIVKRGTLICSINHEFDSYGNSLFSYDYDTNIINRYGIAPCDYGKILNYDVHIKENFEKTDSVHIKEKNISWRQTNAHNKIVIKNCKFHKSNQFSKLSLFRYKNKK